MFIPAPAQHITEQEDGGWLVEGFEGFNTVTNSSEFDTKREAIEEAINCLAHFGGNEIYIEYLNEDEDESLVI